MKDRIPTKPGRVRLTPSADGEDLFVLERADEPSQEGTPLNKASLLSDATAALMGLEQADPTVDDALASVGNRFTMVRTGTAAPGLSTEAKRGDIYIEDAGGAAGRRVYVCDYAGTRAVDTGASWERGGLVLSNGNNEAADYRVRSDMIRLYEGETLSAASGFRFAIVRYTAAGEYVNRVQLRSNDYWIQEDTYARFLVARVTEDTSETADVDEFAAALTVSANGAFWTPLAAIREVRKTVIFTEDDYFRVPNDLHGEVTVQCFGGGAGGSPLNSGNYGGGGGHMASWTGLLTEKKYPVTIGKGGAAGANGGSSSFGSLVTAAGGEGKNGGTGGGGTNGGGSGSYGGGGGSVENGKGGNGGTYGGGGGAGGTGAAAYSGGSGKSGTYAGGSGAGSSSGGGGGGYAANGRNATSDAGGAGGAGLDTTGRGLDFDGPGLAGTTETKAGGGGGGYGGNGGTAGLKAGGGGGGYGADGGNAGTASGGGGGGWGGRGGDGYSNHSGGGGGYGLSGKGGTGNGGNGGYAAGGGATGGSGGNGIVIVYYTGYEASV